MDDAERRWHGRRVLVTGCTGFLGGWTVRELLAGGAEVVGLVRDRTAAGRFARHGLHGRVYPVHGKVEDTFRLHSTLAVHEVSAVFHLAADPTGRGAETVVEAVRRYDPRVPVVTARPTGAQHPVPGTPSPVPFGVARFGQVFGPGDRIESRLVFEQLDEFGAAPFAEGSRDYVYAPDAARACVRLAAALLDGTVSAFATVEFRSGWEMTPDALAGAFRAEFAGRTVAADFQPVAHPLGWCPAVSFTDALRETIASYRGSHRARFTDPPRRAA